MKRASVWLCIVVVFCLSFVFGQQQQTSSSVTGITVPRLIKFAGAVKDASGKPQTGGAGITFSLYKEQQGGAALWMETQNVELDSNGGYTVLLGATQADGLPTELFTSTEARWLGVQIEKEPEQARVLLVAVPYALKASDAETLGGKPLSAFQLVTGATSSRGSSLAAQPAAAEQANEIVCSSTTACKTGFVPLFASNGGSAKVTDSIVTQRGGTVTITGSETATGNISSGGNLSASGNVNANGNVGASTVTTVALIGGVSSTMTGTGNSIAAVQGSATAPGAAGFTFGVIGQSASDNGRGVFGLAPGAAGVGVIGETTGSSGIGVVGKTLNGAGWAFSGSGNALQDRTSGGWVKGMIFGNTNSGGSIVRCFNSTLPGAAATTPPCGFSIVLGQTGALWADIGFEVDDRFLGATVQSNVFTIIEACTIDVCNFLPNNHTILIATRDMNGGLIGTSFHLLVY